LRSAFVELGDDCLSEAAQKEYVALAQLWPLLVCEAAEHVEARVKRREGNAEVGADASGPGDLRSRSWSSACESGTTFESLPVSRRWQ